LESRLFGAVRLDATKKYFENKPMADSYLQLAEEVLRARGKPLSAKLILSDAKRFGLLPEHLSGDTMHKTLQARISDDINILRKKSRFYRVGIGKYFLRELSLDSTLPASMRRESEPKGRVRSIRNSRLLHSHNPFRKTNEKLLDSKTALGWINERNAFKFAGDMSDGEILVGAFTIVRINDAIFLYELGKFSHFYSEDAPKSSSIGLRSYVDEFDDDIFKVAELGMDFAAVREVMRNMEVSVRGVVVDDRYFRRNMKILGAMLEEESRSLFFIVQVSLEISSPHETKFLKRKDVRKPRLLSLGEARRLQLDGPSQLLLDAGVIQ
jgi:hypothetical protein